VAELSASGGNRRTLKIMKTWKIQLIVTGILSLLLAIFAYVMHQRIVGASLDPSVIDAKDDALGLACGKIFGSGLVLIWAWPYLLRKIQLSTLGRGRAMTNSKRVHCGVHGDRRATFVCQHLVRGSGLGFFEPNRAPVLPDESGEQSAWCSECESIRQQQGGWNDKSEAFAHVTMICDACFELSRRRNEKE
jgi:hypothetical protein